MLPKSLFRVGSRELIRYSLDALRPDITDRLVFAVDHKAHDIKAWVQAARLPHTVEFSEQTRPGVLGAIMDAANHIKEDTILACNTDEIRTGLNLEAIVRFHEAQGTLATMVTTYTNQLYRHRLVEAREHDNIVTRTALKPEAYKTHPEKVGLVNTGFLVIEKEAMDLFDANHSKDWGGIIDPLCDAGQLSAYIDPVIRYFNVGTPEEYAEAEAYLKQNP
jgi:NDP-sugar pyrophosphorylase family protein